MRLTAGLLLALAGLAALALWAIGGFQAIGWWVVQQQHAVQSALAGRIQALRAGEPAALWSLIALCAGYGFLHALGPGHGKALVAGAAVGTGATARRMALVATAGSLGQAAVAIALVYGALAIFEATARGTVAAADRWVAPAGNLAVALIGAWILWRGLRALGAARSGAHAHDHGQSCGHAHGPDPAEVARATGPAATLALIAAMAARPCTGALVVLIFALAQGLVWAGVMATFAMALGTGITVATLAGLAVGAKGLAERVFGGEGRAVARVHHVVEGAGAVFVFLLGAVLFIAATGWGVA
jgi:ABC-type nickel/cobalt efflux system permease component RcnA